MPMGDTIVEVGKSRKRLRVVIVYFYLMIVSKQERDESTWKEKNNKHNKN